MLLGKFRQTVIKGDYYVEESDQAIKDLRRPMLDLKYLKYGLPQG